MGHGIEVSPQCKRQISFFIRLKSFGMWLLLPSFNQCLLFVYFLSSNGKKKTISFFLAADVERAAQCLQRETENKRDARSYRNHTEIEGSLKKWIWLGGVVFDHWNMPRLVYVKTLSVPFYDVNDRGHIHVVYSSHGPRYRPKCVGRK